MQRVYEEDAVKLGDRVTAWDVDAYPTASEIVGGFGAVTWTVYETVEIWPLESTTAKTTVSVPTKFPIGVAVTTPEALTVQLMFADWVLVVEQGTATGPTVAKQ
jgi:hypothetical protein